ncbi:MAG: LPXTG cell wall anchor domain-containing protein, partial [Specibacter sp.]
PTTPAPTDEPTTSAPAVDPTVDPTDGPTTSAPAVDPTVDPTQPADGDLANTGFSSVTLMGFGLLLALLGVGAVALTARRRRAAARH